MTEDEKLYYKARDQEFNNQFRDFLDEKGMTTGHIFTKKEISNFFDTFDFMDYLDYIKELKCKK